MAQTEQRLERLRQIAVELDRLVRELAPMWIRMAHLRHEAQLIQDELRDA